MTQLPTQITQELSYSRTYPSPPQLPHQRLLSKQLTSFVSPVSTTTFARISMEVHIRLWGGGAEYNKPNVFSAVGTVFVWNAFKGSGKGSQHLSHIHAYVLSTYWPLPTLLNAFPFEDAQKVTFFLSQLLTEAYSTAESKAKSSLGVCLLEKIAFFIYCPLALFSQWIPGLNAISQETLPTCTPVIPNRLQTESSASKRGKNLSTANQTKKALLLVLPVLSNHKCTSDPLERESQKIKFKINLI